MIRRIKFILIIILFVSLIYLPFFGMDRIETIETIDNSGAFAMGAGITALIFGLLESVRPEKKEAEEEDEPD